MKDHGVNCPYCEQPAALVTGAVIYPHRPDLHGLRFWQCAPCDAFVGCHKNGDGMTPLGTPANKETREARKRAHAAFDPIWRDGSTSRKKAYNWLASTLGYQQGKCHISWMNAEECNRVVIAAQSHDTPQP